MWIVNIYDKSTGLLTNTYWGVGTDMPVPVLKDNEALFDKPLCVEPYFGYINLSTLTFEEFSEEDSRIFKMKDITGAIWNPVTLKWEYSTVSYVNNKKEELADVLKKKKENKLSEPIYVRNTLINGDNAAIVNLQSKFTELTVHTVSDDLMWRLFDNSFLNFPSQEDMLTWVGEAIAEISKRASSIKREFWEISSQISLAESKESIDNISVLVAAW